MPNIEALRQYYNAARLLFEEKTLHYILSDNVWLNPTLTLNCEDINTAAEQVTGTMIIGRALSALAHRQGLEINPTVIDTLITFHDTLETRTGDNGRDRLLYLKEDTAKAASDKFGPFGYGTSQGWGSEIVQLIDRFEKPAANDMEALLARDADALYIIWKVKALQTKGYPLNNPEERIVLARKRLKTQIGQQLGEELAVQDASNFWSFVIQKGEVSHTEQVVLSDVIYETAIAGWVLAELAKEDGESTIDRNRIVQAIILGEDLFGNDPIQPIVEDAKVIYEIIELKYLTLRRIEDRPQHLTGDDQIYSKIDALLLNLKTDEGMILGQIISEMDPNEWRNVMRGFLKIGDDGRAIK